ncbi:MAG: DUF2911 domain-containing protein [Acidobacteriota bacterium]
MNFKLSKSTFALIACLLMVLVAVAPAFAERGDDSSRKSKNGKVEGTVDGVAVTVEYGSPQVRDREIWGALVPYGKVWRTGADEATTVTFGSAAKVGGKAVAAGTYSLFTIPGEGSWTVILNKVAEQWGAYDYAEAEDVVRFEVEPRGGDHVEAMDFVIEGDELVLRWVKTQVPVTISAG